MPTQEITGGRSIDQALPSVWATLVGAIQQYQSSASSSAVGKATVYFNEQGELIDRPESQIANLVYEGAVWVDFCRHPMYYRNVAGFVPTPLFPLGSAFSDFAQQTLGNGLAYGNQLPKFTNPGGIYIPDGLGGALLTSTIPNTVPGLAAPYGVSVFDFAPYATQQASVGTVYVLPLFGIHYGRGWYFYASATNSAWINPAQYAAFIANAVVKPSLFLPGGTTSTAPPPPSGSGGSGGGSGGSSGGSGSGTGSGGSSGGSGSGGSGGTPQGNPLSNPPVSSPSALVNGLIIAGVAGAVLLAADRIDHRRTK